MKTSNSYDNLYLAGILKMLQCGIVPFVNPGHVDGERVTGLALLQEAIGLLESTVEIAIYDNANDRLRSDAPALEAV